MEDVTPSLLKNIQDDFQSEFNKSQLISSLYTRVRDRTATYLEANDFAIEVGEILAGAYKNNLSSDVLPDGKMYYNIAQRILNPTMKNNYELITDVTTQVQKALNETANIGIKPITPELNQDRINGLINRISSADYFDDVSWLLDEPIKNFSQSIVDDSIRTNAEFHAKAGMSPKIVRKLAGGCCDWCRAVAGTYSYPDVPKDVYRRHQRCRCTVDYNPRSGRVQNVHSKKWRDETELDRRKIVGLQGEEEIKATRFKRTFEAVSKDKVVETMRKDSSKWIDSLSEEEIRCIQKYTLNEGDVSPKFYEKLNAMLRGDIEETESLRYYANIISGALKKSKLNHNVICYRGLSINPIMGIEVGKSIGLGQFTSTTVSDSRSFNKQVKIVIYAKKGIRGAAYIENISKMPKQRELLFDKDCIYRVLSNSKELIELEVI